MHVLIPLRTDAYRERYPVATLGMMALLAAVHSLTLAGLIEPERWIFAWSEFRPWTWWTSVLLHADIWHLVFNLVFLWCFGQVVEGTIGAARTLTLAALIAGISGAVEQGLLHAFEGTSLGFSGVLFGLMGAGVILAPRTQVTQASSIFVRVRSSDLALPTFALAYVGINCFYVLLGGLQPSSAVLHIIGLLAGAPLAAAGLKLGWIDAGGWDLFSLRRRGKGGLPELLVSQQEQHSRLQSHARLSKSGDEALRCARCDRAISKQSGRCLYCGPAI